MSTAARAGRAALATAASLVLVAGLGCVLRRRRVRPRRAARSRHPASHARPAPGIADRDHDRARQGQAAARPGASSCVAGVTKVVDAVVRRGVPRGDFPRTDFADAFAGVHQGRRRGRASVTSSLMSNAEIADRIDSATATKRRVAARRPRRRGQGRAGSPPASSSTSTPPATSSAPTRIARPACYLGQGQGRVAGLRLRRDEAGRCEHEPERTARRCVRAVVLGVVLAVAAPRGAGLGGEADRRRCWSKLKHADGGRRRAPTSSGSWPSAPTPGPART